MNKKIILYLTILTTIMILISSATIVMASPPEKIRVNIIFNDVPNENLIISFSGEIKREISLTKSITATVPQTAINALRSHPLVESVEIDYYSKWIQTETLPWGVDRVDAEIIWGGSDGSMQINPGVITGAGVNVSVLDTGIDYNHPDLNDNYAGGKDFVNDDDDPIDDYGHGTHCCGIVGAEENTEGVIGTAPEINIFAVKVLDEFGGGYPSDIAAGIDWAVNNGMDVISMSLGASQSSSIIKTACDNAYAAGLVIVASAGNEYGGDVSYPAKYSSVIAVSATDSADNVAHFSSIGPEVEIAAPGDNILSTIIGGNYGYKSGTSMSCPHVAGGAAMIIQAGVIDNDGQNGIANEVRAYLTNEAENIGLDPTEMGSGLLDVEASVNAVQTSTDTPPSITVNSPNGGESWNAETSHDINWVTTPGTNDVDFIDLEYSTDGGVTYFPIVTGLSGVSSYNWTIPDEHSSNCRVRATVYDTMGLTGTNVSNSFQINGIAPEPASGLTVDHYGSVSVIDTANSFSTANNEWVNTDDYTVTHLDDEGFYHEISEDNTVQGGSGKADLDVIYNIPISSGTSAPFTLCIESYATSDESYTVSYMVNGVGGETNIITLSQSEDFRTYQMNGINPGDTVNVKITDSSQQPREIVGTVFIDHLYIESTGSGSSTSDNLISWTASVDDNSDGDVNYYEVLRCSDSEGSVDASFSVMADGFDSYSYIDNNKGSDDGFVWWYIIKTVDTDGLYSVSNAVSEPAGTNSAPIADFSYSPMSPTTDDTVEFTDLSTDSDGSIVSWDWDFGDGTTSTDQNPNHVFSSEATFTVTLTVTDDFGDTGTLSQTITVTSGTTNQPPTADFTFTPSNPTPTDIVYFEDASVDNDGSIVSWDWDFGDGTTSTDQNPTHQFNSEGTYTISLTVTDDDGETDTISQTITVSSSSSGITLTASGYKVKGRHHIDLTWDGATTDQVEIWRNGILIMTTQNDGAYTDATDNVGNGVYTYQIHEIDGSDNWSNEAIVNFG